MLLGRVNGNFPVLRLRNDLDRAFFGDLFDTFQDWIGEAGGSAFPAINIWEDDRTLYAEAELPGLKMDDLEVSVLGDELTIKGGRREPACENATCHRQERRVGSFSRVIRLPVEVNPEKVQASLKDGVLTVTLPKAETAVPRKITVKAV
jgi:HSP20 family protein